MYEILIVIGIVIIAGVMAGRSFYRTMTDKNHTCVCTGDCHSCTTMTWQKGAGTEDRQMTA